MIRIMIMLSILAVIVWSGFWLFSRQTRINLVESMLMSGSDAGWSISHDAIRASGYPFRVDITLDNLTIRNSDHGLVWHLPRLQILMLSYQFDHIVIAFPETQDISLNRTDYRLTTDGMKASLTTDGAGGILKAFIMEAGRVNLTADTIPVQEIENLLIAIRHESATPGQHRVSLSSYSDADPPNTAILTQRDALLARVLMGLTLDGRFTASTPLGPDACSGDGLTLHRLVVNDLAVREQNAEINLSSDIEFSQAGIPEGWIDLEVNRIRNLLELVEILGYELGAAAGLAGQFIETLGKSLPDGGVGIRLNLSDGAARVFGLDILNVGPLRPLC